MCRDIMTPLPHFANLLNVCLEHLHDLAIIFNTNLGNVCPKVTQRIYRYTESINTVVISIHHLEPASLDKNVSVFIVLITEYKQFALVFKDARFCHLKKFLGVE